MFDRLFGWIGRRVAAHLNAPLAHYQAFAVSDIATLRAVLQPADVVLVDGELRISAVIKYLTQSTWSHAAMYIGEGTAPGGELVEADLVEGVIVVPLDKYRGFNTRIVRAVGLGAEDRERVVRFMSASIGKAYDLKNVTDLLRYLIPLPYVPRGMRRRLISLGSGDPTRAICSTLIAQAFQLVRYPILPRIERCPDDERGRRTRRQILHIRHHSLFTPSDFDLSPFFQVIKPTIAQGFDYRALEWSDAPAGGCGDAAGEGPP